MLNRGIQLVAHRQGSSAVEQGTHKPLVGSSILPSGTPFTSLPSQDKARAPFPVRGLQP